jgi:hypothetical protein
MLAPTCCRERPANPSDCVADLEYDAQKLRERRLTTAFAARENQEWHVVDSARLAIPEKDYRTHAAASSGILMYPSRKQWRLWKEARDG